MNNEKAILLRALEAEAWPAYIVDRSGCIMFTNGAWDRAAELANGPLGKEVVGTPWLAHTAGAELVAWQRELLDRVLTSGGGETHTADCNTATRFRLFSTRYAPIVTRVHCEPEGMVALTSMIEDAPIEARYRVTAPDEQRYRQPSGLIVQCGGCRRVLVAGSAPREWEFVPDYVSEPREDVSHGLCGLCREVHYGMQLRNAG